MPLDYLSWRGCIIMETESDPLSLSVEALDKLADGIGDNLAIIKSGDRFFYYNNQRHFSSDQILHEVPKSEAEALNTLDLLPRGRTAARINLGDKRIYRTVALATGCECVEKDAEFFLCIGKVESGAGTGHTFMMLGVVTEGQPRVLARIGKTVDIAVDLAASCLTNVRNVQGAALTEKGALARLGDEGAFRYTRGEVNEMSYEAHAITLEQLYEYLGFIKYLEEKQLENDSIRAGINKIPEYRRHIGAYIPVKTDPEVDTYQLLEYKLKDWEYPQNTQSSKMTEDKEKMAKSVQRLRIDDTCRTTAKGIIERILGFATSASDCFLTALTYRSRLIDWQPDKDSFYVLPPPPKAYKQNVSKIQYRVLDKLYKRLQEIPKKYPHAVETRAKFNALKDEYKKIGGNPNIDAFALLGHIEQMIKNTAITDSRSSMGRYWGISSTTKNKLKEIETDLNKETKMGKK